MLGRSMCRHGRLIFPAEDEGHNKVWQEWKACPILAKGLLEEAHCIPTKDIVTIEDVSETSLPSSTSLTHNANAAEKVCQLGKDAYLSLLRGSLQTLGSKSSKPVILIVDLFAHTGDLGAAVLKEKFNPGMSNHLHYLGFHASQMEVCVCGTNVNVEVVKDKVFKSLI